jgi:UDP:flavonoid glycosyltransferase YjiC (YdhE family)
MKIAFVGVSTPEHLSALTTLARKIKDRGHDVLFSSRARSLCLVHRAAIALVRTLEKPSRNDPHLRIARLVAAAHPVS